LRLYGQTKLEIMRIIGTGLIENIKMAFNTLKANKLRSFLTIFGVLVGVITVMLIGSIISGFDMALKKEIESFGTNSIFLYKFDVGITGPPSREQRMRKPLTIDDATALQNLSTVKTAVPFLDISNNFFGRKILVTGKNGKTSSSVLLNGTFPEMEKTDTEILIDGRWFTKSEDESKADVCLIGDTVRESYFPYENPIGKTLEVGGREFRVIGTLQKREQLFGGGGGDNDQSNIVFMPIGSALRLKPFADDVFILAVAKEGMLEQAKEQAQDLLRIRRKVPFGEPNSFSMSTADTIVSQFRSLTIGFALATIGIASIGLLIGGIGVMNIMLVSVTERTREIGIRKAIGAKRSDILLQFLIEAVTLTGFGGIVGLVIGWLLSLLIQLVTPTYLPIWAPILGFGFSVAIGLIFGIFPAWKAARLDPIEALRYE
jgi:putative ABC transport system permease protein